jgi:hypothetical protein
MVALRSGVAPRSPSSSFGGGSWSWSSLLAEGDYGGSGEVSGGFLPLGKLGSGSKLGGSDHAAGLGVIVD